MLIDEDNQLTGIIIGATIAVHRELGPGVNEAACERALSLKLASLGISHEVQKPLALLYKGASLDCGYRLDVLVDERLPLELKSVEVLLPVHSAQVLTYMRLGAFPLGLLINFDVPVLKNGLKRFAITKPQRTAAQSSPGECDSLSSALLAAAVEVHRVLGPGLLRSAYEECLCHELRLRDIPFARAKKVPLSFEGHELGHSAEMPLLVSDRIPVCCLSATSIAPLHESRLLARLRQVHLPYGFVLNFNASTLAKGIRRISCS